MIDTELFIAVLRGAKKTDFVNARGMLFEAYETAFRVHDYVAQQRNEQATKDPNLKRPLSAVALHEPEDLTGMSEWDKMLRLYLDKGVYTQMGLSFDQFLMFPHHRVEAILKECAKRTRVDSTNHENAVKKLEEAVSRPATTSGNNPKMN